MLSMGMPLYIFAIAFVILLVAGILSCCIPKPPVDSPEGGEEEETKFVEVA